MLVVFYCRLEMHMTHHKAIKNYVQNRKGTSRDLHVMIKVRVSDRVNVVTCTSGLAPLEVDIKAALTCKIK